MTVQSLLKNDRAKVVTCRPDDTVELVARLLTKNRIGAVPVIDGKGKLVGVISERDIVRGLSETPAKVADRRVKELMTADVATCRPTDHVKDVMAVMARRHIRHLPVLENGELRDMLSQRDVMISRIEQTELEVNVLRDYAIATVGAARG